MTDPAVGFSPTLAELADDYELLGELGRGGHAVVYRARDRQLGRPVAIKVVYPRHPAAVAGDDDEAVARLAREARTVAQLQHPNIVTVFAVRRLRGGGLALVMPLVPGRTLKQIVQRDGALPPEECERVLRDVAAALAYAHARNVVHRDVKPENIFLDEDTGRALLADFGIALSEEHESPTLTGTAIGTPFYMSPEQIDGAQLDGRSDLYSLGLVAWEMLTGRRPWDGESLYNVIYKQKHEELPPIEGLRAGVPPRLQYIVERMLQKHPSARWAGADGLLAQLSHTVLPRDYAKWQSSLRKRVERYRAEERKRAASGESAAAGGGLAAATMRVLRSAMRASPGDAPGLANTVSLDVPESLRTSEPPATAPEDALPADTAPTEVVSTEGVGAPARRGRAVPARRLAGGARPGPGMRALIASGVMLGALALAAAATRDRWAPLLEAARARMAGGVPATPAAATPPSPGAADIVPSVATSVAASDSPNAAPAAPNAVAPVPATGAAAGTSLLVPVGRAGTTLAAGGRHNCLVALGATVHCWGANDRGQLGDATAAGRRAPTLVTGELAFAQVGAGTAHTCAVTRVGDVYCWGSNVRGQLGDATTVLRQAPVRVAGPGAYRLVRAGASHSCAVTYDGAVHCWGANDRGQLGDGSRTARHRPTAAATSPGLAFTAVVTGGTHSCALTAAGAAYCWGANDAGQVGDGTADDRVTPTPVAGGHRFAALAAGQSHSCGVTVGGEVYCWGRNSFGQLGVARVATMMSPARVALPAPAAAVAAGIGHTCALTTAGDVLCWGRNSSGQLGDGGTADRPRPARARTPEPMSEIDAAALHTCALSFAGRAYCWGNNGSGQLGDGTAANRGTPTEVPLGSVSPALPPAVARASR